MIGGESWGGGLLVVEHGQRRTLAAVEAGAATVPVYVVPAPDDADRIVDQVSENDHRSPITTADRIHAWEQLTAVGLSAGDIAKRTASKSADVDTGLKVLASTAAVSAVDEWCRVDVPMTLQQAAVIAEFDDDPEAIEQLVVAVANRGFDHLAQQLRDDRAEYEAKRALEQELAATGVRIVDAPAWDSKTTKGVEYLKTGKKNCTAANHADCPGHAAYLRGRNTWDSVNQKSVTTYEAVYVCTDWTGNGHTDRYGGSSTPCRTGGSGAGSSSGKDDAAEKAEASAERKRVIAGNKAWKSATTVRRAWLAEFATSSAASMC